MTRIERQWLRFRPSLSYVRGHKRCRVCKCWIHKKMEDCQPCQGTIPECSKLHKF